MHLNLLNRYISSTDIGHSYTIPVMRVSYNLKLFLFGLFMIVRDTNHFSITETLIGVLHFKYSLKETSIIQSFIQIKSGLLKVAINGHISQYSATKPNCSVLIIIVTVSVITDKKVRYMYTIIDGEINFVLI
jgi:hypothetical protein